MTAAVRGEWTWVAIAAVACVLAVAAPVRGAKAQVPRSAPAPAAAASGPAEGARAELAPPSGRTDPAAAPAPPPVRAPDAAAATHAGAPVIVYNRRIAMLRAPLFGVSPQERARRASDNVALALALGGPGHVALERTALGVVLKVDGTFAFAITPADVDLERGEQQDAVATAAAARLDEAIAATRESRDTSRMLAGVARVAVATLVALALLFVVRTAAAAAGRGLLRLAGSGADRLRVGGTYLLQRDRMVAGTRRVVIGLRWVLTALVAYEWLGFVLASFPYTRPWGEQLNRLLLELLAMLGGGIVGALPDLVVAFAIFWLAWIVDRAIGAFLDRASRTPGSLSWLDADTVGPAKRLKTAAVWLFALAMAYPYLPGSDTEAFKGVTVLAGLMISLGGSSLVGQAASGLVLMYTRTLRVGEYVSIDGNEGTIVEIGTFATRMRTGRGEELALPNSLVMSTVTRNYSRTVRGHGFVVDTEVTIGYDTPWRQVHAMLVEAARRTPGVIASPAPQVFQTGLSDFYPQYRLVCQAIPADPRPRAEVLSALHANIQDVFNENAVQIMSPHYLGDPDDAKVVAPSRWDPALAPRAGAERAAGDAGRAGPAGAAAGP
ncbi:MAG: mechanosensitive ion channel, partial [Burkholderiales bacterium]|nr:mechanosensitive ion channel [Burkholderiales bacterium]